MSKQVSDSECLLVTLFIKISTFLYPQLLSKKKVTSFCLNVDKEEFKNPVLKKAWQAACLCIQDEFILFVLPKSVW